MNRTHLSLIAAVALCATPALAIQEVPVSPRAPSFAVGGAAYAPLPLAGPLSFAQPDVDAGRDPRVWAFSGGETSRVGSLLFNTTSGPSWRMDGFGPMSAVPMSFAPMGRSFGDPAFGWTTRQTAGVLAAPNLMFYTSVGRTDFGPARSALPSGPPGLALSEQTGPRMDMRAGMKMELMPGVVFGMEAAFSPAQR
jgi:hypothetical protein